MPNRWLSLEIKSRDGSPPGLRALKSLVISVPRRIIPLATRRNRLRRLIREVVRSRIPKGPQEKIYWFKVLKKPVPDPKLADVKSEIQEAGWPGKL